MAAEAEAIARPMPRDAPETRAVFERRAGLASQPRRTSAENREHLLDVAHELFYWRGIRATGVDTIAAEAGVAPTVLYRSFASKDDLVTAYIERAEARHHAWFTRRWSPVVARWPIGSTRSSSPSRR